MTPSCPFRPKRCGVAWTPRIALVLVLSFSGSAAFAASLFAPHVMYPTSSAPYFLTMADLNGDGRLDVAATGFTANRVSVLMGSGTGTLGPKTDYVTGANPYSVAFGDMNLDGSVDMVVANYGSNSVSIFANDGSGSFGPRTNFVTGTHPRPVAIADMNQDGAPDVVVANEGGNTVSVLLGDGGGLLNPKVDYPIGTWPSSVAVGDLNGDGWPDVAATNYGASGDGSTVSILLNIPGSGLGAKTDYPTGVGPYSVAIADLNGDNKPDLVVTNAGAGGGNTVSTLMGNGLGGFAGRRDFTTGLAPTSVAVGDVNGDARLDLVVANSSDNTVSVLLGDGTGSFAPALAFPTGASPWSVAVGDLNGDGESDLATADVGANSVSVLLANSFAPLITQVVDVPGDQGGKVHVLWSASIVDAAPAYGVASYTLWRRIATSAALQALQRGSAHLAAVSPGEAGPGALRFSVQGAQGIYWEFVGSVPGRGQSGYGVMAPTSADSMSGGIPWNVFLVDAVTSPSPLKFFVSAADSGYSVDNLPPGPPAAFTGEYLSTSNATSLHWAASAEPDFSQYRLYRGSSAGFVPGPANRIATLGGTGYTDAGAAGQYYKLSAVDVHGNESAFALLTPAQTLDVGDGAPSPFALEPAWPNPSRRGLIVRFALASAAPARLEWLDVGGRRIGAMDVGALGVGRHAVDVSAASRLTPGVYVVRLTQGRDQRVIRVAILD